MKELYDKVNGIGDKDNLKQIAPSPEYFIAPGAVVVGAVSIGQESSVWYNAVLRGIPGKITIGQRSNIQDCCVAHAGSDTPVVIGDDVTVGHSAILHGCTVGNRCIIGMGSILMNGSEISEDSIVAAGSLVTEKKSFPRGSMIMGRPAKVTRKLTDQEISSIKTSAQHYIEYASIAGQKS
jgi:carbonic anhydrase/acetyltransferase-like protein (isoleucine patch superfamily)